MKEQEGAGVVLLTYCHYSNFMSTWKRGRAQFDLDCIGKKIRAILTVYISEQVCDHHIDSAFFLKPLLLTQLPL